MAKKGIQTNGSNIGDSNSYFNPGNLTIPTETPSVPQNPVPDIQIPIPGAAPVYQPTDIPAQSGTPSQGTGSDNGVEGDSGNKYAGLPSLYLTLLGGTSSGKSSFMAGFVQSMVLQSKTLRSQQVTARISLKLIEYRSSDSLMSITGGDSGQAILDTLGLGQIISSLTFYWDGQNMRFPEGTTGNSKRYTFVVLVNNTAVAKLIIMDYMGGYIDSPDTHTKEEMLELGRICSASHAIVIMSDASKIVESMVGGEIQTETAHFLMNASQINQTMFTISENAKHPVTTVFAITKSDLPAVREKKNLCANNFKYAAELLADIVYNGAFDDLSANENWWHAVIPVSAVGQNKVDDRNNFLDGVIIRQENIDTTVLFCMFSQLGLLIAEQTENVRQAKRRRYELRALFSTRRERLARKEAHILAQKRLGELQRLQNIMSSHISDFAGTMPLVHMSGITVIDRWEEGLQS